MDKKMRKLRQYLANKDIIANAPPFTEDDVANLKNKAKKVIK